MFQSGIMTVFKKTGYLLWWMFLGIGICCMALWIASTSLAGFEIRGITATLEFPIGDLKRFTSDSQGWLYCLDGVYNRLQIYDNNGDFVRGWFSPIGVLWVDSKDESIFLATPNEMYTKYDFNGHVIKKWKEEKGSFRTLLLNGDVSYESKDAVGNVYKMHSRLLSTKIAKITPSGEKTIIVKEPLYLWLIRFPFPGFMYVVVPLALWQASKTLSKKKQKKLEMGNSSPSSGNDPTD